MIFSNVIKRLGLVLATALIGFPAWSKPDLDALYAMVEAGQTDQVQALFENTAKADHTSDFNDSRALMTAIMVSEPKVYAFVENWVIRHPDSLYAQTARGWSIYGNAARFRGERTAAETADEALAAYAKGMEAAQELAEVAYQTDPGYVPASDLMMLTIKGGWFEDGVPEILAKTMALTPNLGSMTRAASIASAPWGGDFETTMGYCDLYLPLIATEPALDIDSCKILLAAKFDSRLFYDPSFAAALRETTHPLLRETRLKLMERAEISPAMPLTASQRDELKDYAAQETATSVGLAMVYDQYIAKPEGLPQIRETFYRRRYEELTRLARHDPLNFDLQKERYDLVPKVFEYRDPKKPDGVLDFFGPIAASSPYDPDIWGLLAVSVEVSTHPQISEMSPEPFYINEFLLSGGHAFTMAEYAQSAFRTWDTKRYFGKGEAPAEEMSCRTIRAIRYAAHLCKVQEIEGEYPCQQLPGSGLEDDRMSVTYSQALDELAANLPETAYPDFRNLPPEQLAYELQPFDFEALRASIVH